LGEKATDREVEKKILKFQTIAAVAALYPF
jgi:hypothetical protein